MKKNGFTLVELLVVLSVIGILSTVGVAAFVNYSRAQAINSGILSFVSFLQTAKSLTLSQVVRDSKGDDLCPVNNKFTGYEVRICISSNGCRSGTNDKKYELNILCDNLNTSSSNPRDTNNLPTSVKFGSGPTVFTFHPITGGVDGVSSSGTRLNIDNDYGLPQRWIMVYSDGRVEVH